MCGNIGFCVVRTSFLIPPLLMYTYHTYYLRSQFNVMNASVSTMNVCNLLRGKCASKNT